MNYVMFITLTVHEVQIVRNLSILLYLENKVKNQNYNKKILNSSN